MSGVFVTKAGLKERGITASWPAIAAWVRKGIFPAPVTISPGRIGWYLTDIEKFEASRPLAPLPPPVLWTPVTTRPPVPGQFKNAGRPVGARGYRDDEGKLRIRMPETANA